MFRPEAVGAKRGERKGGAEREYGSRRGAGEGGKPRGVKIMEFEGTGREWELPSEVGSVLTERGGSEWN